MMDNVPGFTLSSIIDTACVYVCVYSWNQNIYCPSSSLPGNLSYGAQEDIE